MDNIILPKIKGNVQRFWNENVQDPKLVKDIQKWLVEKYGSETFYNDLDRYLKENHTINNLIHMSYGENGFEESSSTQFQLKHCNKFTIEYPQYDKPEYKNVINSIFDELFDRVFYSINSFSMLSDHSKLSNKIDCQFNNLKKHFDDGNAEILRAIQKSECNEASGTEAFSNDVLNTSSESQKFFDRIQEIENCFQKDKRFHDALKEYTKILSELFSVNIKKNSQEYNKLVNALNCNMALCYSNIGDRNTAQEYLDRIPKEISVTNPKYHYICAAVIVNSEDIDHYIDALYHVKRAIEIEPDYSKAFILEKKLRAMVQPSNITETLIEYDSYFSKLLSEKTESQLLFQYYSNRGLIQLAGSEFEGALADFEKASKYGDDQALKFHTAFALYSIAI